MKIGESALHTFTLPFELENPESLSVHYRQKSGLVIEKITEDVVDYDISDGATTFSVWLSPEETELFRNGEAAITVKIVTGEGETMISDIFFCPIEGFPQ